MNYIYGIHTQNGQVCENLKTVGHRHSELSGYVRTTRECSDGTKLHDRCRIVEKYASKEANGLCYDWYTITDHSRDTDVAGKTGAAVERMSANLDYLAMMTGVDIPEKEEEQHG